ncbi:MAG: hypothetical protein ACRERC_27540 [Candidatus Binatia bacterium]
MTKRGSGQARLLALQQRHDRQRRRSAYHEAGHVSVGVAIGLGIPMAIEMDPRGESLARMRWNYDVLAAPTEQRERVALHFLAGYVAECRARGWRRVNAVPYCARRSYWSDGHPLDVAALPSGWLQHSDGDRVAILYSSRDNPRALPDDVLVNLWARTAEIIHAPLVWRALEDLALLLLTSGSVERHTLVAWLDRHPALDRSALR